MAEAFGVVVSAFTVVEIAGKLGSSTIKLKKLWNEVQDVPREINQLVEQVDILNAILTEMDVELSKAGTPSIGTSDASLRCCQQVANELEILATDLQQQILTAKKSRRSITKLRVTLKKDLIQSCQQKLQFALQMALLSQNTRIFASIASRTESTMSDVKTPKTTAFTPGAYSSRQVRLTDEPNFESVASVRKASRMEPLHNAQSSFFGGFTSRTVPHSKYHDVQVYQARLQLPWWVSARLWDIQTYRAHAGWKFCLRAWTVRPYSSTPIFEYIEDGYWTLALREIEEQRASVFDRDEFGWTLLHFAISYERIEIIRHLLGMGLYLDDTDGQTFDLVVPFLRFCKPNETLELFKIWVHVALDDCLENYFTPEETTGNLAAISSFIWKDHEAHQYMTRSLATTYYQLPLKARYAHLNWYHVDPQILLHDIQHDGGIKPADFSVILDTSGQSSLERFVSCYTTIKVYDELPGWKELARWIFQGVSSQRLSMQTPFDAAEEEPCHYTPFFSGLFENIWGHWECRRQTSCYLRRLLEDVQISGHDLEEYGRREMEYFKCEARVRSKRLSTWIKGSGHQSGMRLVTFTYGPQPGDWNLVLSLEAEEYAGEFWDLIENPPLRVPGAVGLIYLQTSSKLTFARIKIAVLLKISWKLRKRDKGKRTSEDRIRVWLLSASCSFQIYDVMAFVYWTQPLIPAGEPQSRKFFRSKNAWRAMETNPAERAMLATGKARVHVDILEHELLHYLRNSYNFSVQRRQLVSILGLWGAFKYSTRDEQELSLLLGQHIQDLVKTGSLFAGSLTKGYNLFRWANEADQIIHNSHINDSSLTSSVIKLLINLDGLITDEHPQLMNVLFGVWEGITQIDYVNIASRYFIRQVYALCQKLLGEDNLTTRIFNCLDSGIFESAKCLELLEFLPAKLFAHKTESPGFMQSDMSRLLALRHLRENNGEQAQRYSITALSNIPVFPTTFSIPPSVYPGSLPFLDWKTSTEKRLAESSHEQLLKNIATGPQPQTGTVISSNSAKTVPSAELTHNHTQSSIERSDELDIRGSWSPKKPGQVSSSVLEHIEQSSINIHYNHTHPFMEALVEIKKSDPAGPFVHQTSDCQMPDHESPGYRLKTQNSWSPHETECQVAVVESSVSPYGESDVTSDSNADKQHQMRALEAERCRIVQNVMDAFLYDLDSHLEGITSNFIAVKEEDASELTQVPSQAEGSTMRERSQMPRKRHKSCDGKKGIGGWRDQGKSGDKDECDESDNEEDGGKKRPRKVPRCRDEMGGILFACPFFKWNPLAYARKKECSCPGWESVHRLKEHLYRRHERPPFQCSRCCNWFDKQNALDSHLRVGSIDQLCEIINESDLSREFKFGPDAKSRLKMKSSLKQTEAERWKAVCRILFDVREDEIPTPYYDHDITALGREESWKEYARREIMILLRQRIEAEVEERFANLGPELIAGLRDIVHDLELTMRRNFERRQEEARNLNQQESPSMTPPLPMPPAALDESSTNTARTPGNDEGEVAVVPQTVLNTDNNLAGNFPLDDSQQEIHSARLEASGMDTQNWRIVVGEEPLYPSLLDADFDFDFINYDGGNNTF
ncbi:hypothetical protein CSIM01_05537 [Colletotrichum simmondsii]|uniref:Uncharacterized protein n=1 Tax=Colletotrichum simmondsii TaxID=703756 RepID=A0A135S1I4_9PEZI|nr:hypothetical protein CSIM01_05537 [Colletotrichum simmondsii]